MNNLGGQTTPTLSSYHVWCKNQDKPFQWVNYDPVSNQYFVNWRNDRPTIIILRKQFDMIIDHEKRLEFVDALITRHRHLYG